jgi:hypothetical protein
MSTTNLLLTNMDLDLGVSGGKPASIPLRVGKASKLLKFDIIIIIIIENGTIGQNMS